MATKRMGKMPPAFEKSAADREKRGMREGSPREEAMDKRQARGAKPSKMPFKGAKPAKGNPFKGY